MRYFVGLGAQKCGTSWLHHQLGLHPQVAVPQPKELHYFDGVHRPRAGPRFGTHFVPSLRASAERVREGGTTRADARRVDAAADWLDFVMRGDHAYRARLRRHADEHTVVAGEITPSYSTLGDEGFAAIGPALEQPRAIFLMRDPLARYWSAVKFAVKDRGDPAEVFAEHWRLPTVQVRGDYRTTLELIDRHLPADDVLVLFYEDLVGEEGLRRVASFLGVDEVWDWELTAKPLATARTPMPDVTPELAAELRPQYEYVRDRFGAAVPARWAGV
ncbi:hypothetical protein GCM10023340_33350 [Nocardioides marinquilinus]|uniref:Sulfotransferase n=1 Tax=Nocardioides marinquilinus TaxID=1210400 RepID=A0ABP9PV49_9ACTN